MTDSSAFAHDLRNLLAIILGYSDLLLAEMAASDHRHADLAEIRKAAQGAMDLLDRWSSSSSPQEGA